MLNFELLVLTADFPASRPDYASLPTQSKMELLIAEFHEITRNSIHGDDGFFLDVCAWPGVKCNCDEVVTSINWRLTKDVGGTIYLEFLPETVESFTIRTCGFNGSVEAKNLPPGLRFMTLNRNRLEGTMDFRSLPASLTDFDMNENNFTGPVDLTNLPVSLRSLLFEKNEFEGTIDLTKLPSEMYHLNASHNKLTGCVDLTRLPKFIEELNISANAFHGEVDLTQLPKELLTLNISQNAFTGKLSITNTPISLSSINVARNHFLPIACIDIDDDNEPKVVFLDAAVKEVFDCSGRKVSDEITFWIDDQGREVKFYSDTNEECICD